MPLMNLFLFSFWGHSYGVVELKTFSGCKKPEKEVG